MILTKDEKSKINLIDIIQVYNLNGSTKDIFLWMFERNEKASLREIIEGTIKGVRTVRHSIRKLLYHKLIKKGSNMMDLRSRYYGINKETLQKFTL